MTVQEFDALALPGGFEEAGFYKDAFRPDVLEFIREFDRQGKNIASICVGALPLGRSGVLQGRNATTLNHLLPQKMQTMLKSSWDSLHNFRWRSNRVSFGKG
ncbi:DJ-1/PfpI family protein [Paenibacillus sp. MER TA 81-3]|uniref:DJ-1/PfpI family protein n=1 Tax=Paenibacillus sp. MER TA 81-3 TaxID=2939573 RepID=UPI00203AEAD6|nr:DJ-1/PfpI family protein [Paenibacillus sp. MER TA 81-3]MCM3340710.1 DJ-1/PfpI family protein [Paenibacillus sp. MER TA 81-3]